MPHRIDKKRAAERLSSARRARWRGIGGGLAFPCCRSALLTIHREKPRFMERRDCAIVARF